MPFLSVLLMDLGKQIGEKPRKAPAMWDVGGTVKFGTKVLAPGRGWVLCGLSGWQVTCCQPFRQLEGGVEYRGNVEGSA